VLKIRTVRNVLGVNGKLLDSINSDFYERTVRNWTCVAQDRTADGPL
jgi:hypothetical protein